MKRLELLPMPNWRRVGACFGALAGLGCTSAAPRPSHAPVELSETLPAGYDSLGMVSAACRVQPRERSFRGEPATSFACGRNELVRALVERANARGANLLAHESCEREGEDALVCTAEAARPRSAAPEKAERSAQSADRDDELLVSVASRIRIDVDSEHSLGRRARDPSDVAEFAQLPIGHVEVGVMRARCSPSDCDADAARASLRLAAGALGASELVGVRCVSFDGERACIATLGVAERDPETDPLAR